MSAPNDLTMGTRDVFVVGCSLDEADPAGMRVLLDDAERSRADRFVREIHGQRYTVAHATLRLVLSHVVGAAPQALRFRNGAYGKPALADPGCDVRFNLSHSENRALIAIARGREVGIDIEQKRSVEPLELAPVCFSRRERAALELTPAPERVHAFFRGWTRKESFIKANGRGLSCPLDSFDVSLDEAFGNVLLAYRSGDDEPDRSWTTHPLEAGDRFAAAITVEGSDWRLAKWETVIGGLQELTAIHAWSAQTNCGWQP